MFFLIKFGYMPLYRISQVHNMSGDRPLTQKENRVLLDDLNFYVKNKDKLPDWFGTCPFLIRMLYAPRGAQALLERIKTIS